ncbi:helix-turn-helix domain-containing protein [Enterococcus sp.]|uniref:helix-turn-helix domain-containing protein n=1 Tax=Enterococcus sp. TaxID=35783 RepID=UPI002FC7F4E5
MGYDLLKNADISLFGAKLRTVREFKGLTRSQAAEGAGVSPSWLQKIETGKHLNGTPAPEKLLNYCNSLGIKLELTYNVTLTRTNKNKTEKVKEDK